MRPHFLDPSITVPEGLPHDLAAMFQSHGYQAWIMQRMRPWLGKRILELGAGCGAMSRWFQEADRLILAEPEPALNKVLADLSTLWFKDPSIIRIYGQTVTPDNITDLCSENIDTAISFNVLEHIEDEMPTFQAMAELLRSSTAPGPRRLISFVPAHPFAFGSWDKADGHFRRYTRSRLRDLAQRAAPEASHSLFSFNFFGLWGWYLNSRLLKRPNVGGSNVRAFETLLPFMKPVDQLLLSGLRIPLGQSLISVLEWAHHESEAL